MTNPWAAGRLTPGRRPRVMFGRMYEDHGVELELFPPGSRVLAIASAGDTAVALAAAGHRVTAVDINARQLAYARAGTFSPGTAERLQAVARGAARVVAPAWRPGPMTRFLELTDPAEQLAWWHEHLDRPALRALMFLALRPAALATAVHKGLHDVVPDRFDAVLRRRIAVTVGRWHELRLPSLRQALFAEVARTLRPGGRLLLVEHCRHAATIAAYGPGAWHFFPRTEWLRQASGAGLTLTDTRTMTPLVHALVFTR